MHCNFQSEFPLKHMRPTCIWTRFCWITQIWWYSLMQWILLYFWVFQHHVLSQAINTYILILKWDSGGILLARKYKFISLTWSDELKTHISEQQNSTVLSISSAFLYLGFVILLSNHVDILQSLCTIGSSDCHHALTQTHTHTHMQTHTHMRTHTHTYTHTHTHTHTHWQCEAWLSYQV